MPGMHAKEVQNQKYIIQNLSKTDMIRIVWCYHWWYDMTSTTPYTAGKIKRHVCFCFILKHILYIYIKKNTAVFNNKIYFCENIRACINIRTQQHDTYHKKNNAFLFVYIF